MADDIFGTEWLTSYVDPETQMKHFRRQKQFHNLSITIAYQSYLKMCWDQPRKYLLITKGKDSSFTVEKPAGTILTKWSTLTSLIYQLSTMMHWRQNITFVVFLTKILNLNLVRRNHQTNQTKGLYTK